MIQMFHHWLLFCFCMRLHRSEMSKYFQRKILHYKLHNVLPSNFRRGSCKTANHHISTTMSLDVKWHICAENRIMPDLSSAYPVIEVLRHSINFDLSH